MSDTLVYHLYPDTDGRITVVVPYWNGGYHAPWCPRASNTIIKFALNVSYDALVIHPCKE